MPLSIQIASRPLDPPVIGVNNYKGLQSKSEVLPKGWNGFNARPLPCDILVEHDVPVIVRDGCTLYSDVYRPPGSGPTDKVPAIVCYSPFGKKLNGLTFLPMMTPYNVGVPLDCLSGLEKFEAPDPAVLVPHGYAVINVDGRGVGDSDGSCPTLGVQEGEDAYDLIEAFARKEWCNGKVGMAGNSHLAIAQWHTAQLNPPSLAAIAPWEGCGDLFREQFVRGGIFTGAFQRLITKKMIQGRNGVEDLDEMYRRCPTSNIFWEDKRPDITKITISAYISGTRAHPVHAMGSVRGWLEVNSPNKWLRFSGRQEWNEIWSDQEALDELICFFDHFLKGLDNGWEKTPRVRLAALQFGNVDPITNIVEEDFPVPRTRYRELYLGPDASLSLDKTISPQYTMHDSEAAGTYSAFTYTFDRDTRLMGLPKTILYVSSEQADDMDIYVLLRKLDANGVTMLNLTIPWNSIEPSSVDEIPKRKDSDLLLYMGPKGILRASHREIDESRSIHPNYPFHPHKTLQKIPPGDIVKLEIGMWPMGIDYRAGESIQLQVSGIDPSMHPHEGLEGTAPRGCNKGLHKVHFGGDHDSRVILPFV